LVRKAAAEVYDSRFPARLWFGRPAGVAAAIVAGVAVLLLSAWVGSSWLRDPGVTGPEGGAAPAVAPVPVPVAAPVAAAEPAPVAVLDVLERGEPGRTGTDAAFA